MYFNSSESKITPNYKRKCIEKCLECSKCSKRMQIAGNSYHHWTNCFDFISGPIISLQSFLPTMELNCAWIYTLDNIFLDKHGKQISAICFLNFSQWYIC